jgi:cell division protein ZapA
VDPQKSVVTVDIAGQRYPIRSGLDPAYVAELAAYVDKKMRAAAEAAPSTDTLGLAVLVALNLADEYFRARQNESSSQGHLNERALRLEQLVDQALSR